MKLIPKQTASTVAEQVSPELQEQVRSRAYELYEQRGRADGHDLDDWLQAESEIIQNKREVVAA